MLPDNGRRPRMCSCTAGACGSRPLLKYPCLLRRDAIAKCVGFRDTARPPPPVSIYPAERRTCCIGFWILFCFESPMVDYTSFPRFWSRSCLQLAASSSGRDPIDGCRFCTLQNELFLSHRAFEHRELKKSPETTRKTKNVYLSIGFSTIYDRSALVFSKSKNLRIFYIRSQEIDK